MRAEQLNQVDNPEYIIKNDRILLRILGEADKETYFAHCYNDSLISHIVDFNNSQVKESFWEKLTHGKDIQILIILLEENRYIGHITIRNTDEEIPELGIEIFEGYKKQGIATEALQLLIKSSGEIEGLAGYILRIYEDNHSSRKMAEKLGAILVDKEIDEYAIRMKHLYDSVGKIKFEEIAGESLEKIVERHNGNIFVYQLKIGES